MRNLQKVIYVITHGEKNDGPNPSLTDYGKEQIRFFKECLPNVQKVVAGLARRHLDMIEALGLNFEECFFADELGRATSLKPGTNDQVYLADGTVIQRNKYIMLPASVVWELVKNQPDSTLLLGGRPLAKAILKFATNVPSPPEALTASLYEFTFKDGEIVNVKCQSAGKVEGDGYHKEV